MRFLLFGLLTALLGGLLAWAWRRGVAGLYPGAWARPRVRRAIDLGLLAWGGVVLALPLARALEAPPPVRVALTAIGGAGMLALLLTLPFVLVGRTLRRKVEPIEPEVLVPPPPSALTRRELALHGARAMPLMGAGLAVSGARDADDVVLAEIEMAFPELPPALEGLRILQYSDVHLGHFIDLAEVGRLVDRGRAAKADLVVLTGDIADDLGELPRALALFSSLAPRLGVFASIGNHEYFRGIRDARRAYDRSEVPLLLESGHALKVEDATLYLAGIDDPRYLGRQRKEFFSRTMDQALDGAPSDAFHLVMSHRPEGFAAARELGVQLTLSGHTHGAQLGVGGRSLLEPLLPEQYLWGAYAEGGSRLYTSSGAGHWFPFRLGCPRELPVIKLVRGPAGAAAVKRRIG